MDLKPLSRDPSESGLQACVRNISKGSRFLWNATLLRCPLCGTQPLFVPLSKVKKIYDWINPLDGCPRCGYPYDREAGYFLFAVWAFSYISSIIVGFGVYLGLSIGTSWPFQWRLILTLVAMFFFGLGFARHAKAYFIALDQFCDPEKREKSSGN